jgi:hypothetical protein
MRRLMLTAAALLLAAGGSTRAEDARLEKVLADWKARRERVRDARYRVEGERIVPRGAFTDPDTGAPLDPPQPPKDTRCPKKQRIVLDFVRQRHRIETDEMALSSQTGKLFRIYNVNTFNGNEFKEALPRAENDSADRPFGAQRPELTIGTGDFRGVGAFVTENWPCLFGHGALPTLVDFPHPGELRLEPDAEMLSIHGNATHDGRNCLILRAHPQTYSVTTIDEYWVDVERGSAVVRYVTYSESQPVLDLQLTYEETPSGWFPEKWEVTRRQRGGKAFAVERMRVMERELNANTAEAEFDIPVRPGMVVQKVRYGEKAGAPTSLPAEQRTFRVGEWGQWNEIVNGVERPNLSWLVWVLVAALSALALAGLGVFAVRRRRR